MHVNIKAPGIPVKKKLDQSRLLNEAFFDLENIYEQTEMMNLGSSEF